MLTDTYLLTAYNARHMRSILMEGARLFQDLRWKAQLGQWWKTITGRRHHLSTLPKGAQAGAYAGVQTVALQKIQGSEDRTQDFDADFNPLTDATRERWLSIFRAWRQEKALPPVELVEVNGVYYVRDGHHRISVAHALGQDYIEAVVMRWKSGRV